MPTFKEREKHIELWIAEFGQRARHSITGAEIAIVLTRWRLSGLAASTVNHRRTALMHLWTVLDGKGTPNPVKQTDKQTEPKPEPPALSYKQIEASQDAMHDVVQALAGKARDDASKTKAWLAGLAYTGIPAAKLRRLKPSDVNLRTRMMHVSARRKGRGTDGADLPLSAAGLAALRAFDALDCWGNFSTSSMWKSFQRACEKADIIGGRPYDLRHSFGTLLYAETGDSRAVQELLMHTTQ